MSSRKYWVNQKPASDLLKEWCWSAYCFFKYSNKNWAIKVQFSCVTWSKFDIFSCDNNFLERAHLTKIKTGIYWRSGVGARIALASGKLRRSYSLTILYGIVSYLYGMVWCSLIFNHSKTSPAHGKRQRACLLYISSRSLTLERSVALQQAHADEGSSQIAFCPFADWSNNSLCGVLMKILLEEPRTRTIRDYAT